MKIDNCGTCFSFFWTTLWSFACTTYTVEFLQESMHTVKSFQASTQTLLIKPFDDFMLHTAKENDVMIMKWKRLLTQLTSPKPEALKHISWCLQTPTTLCQCIGLHKVQNSQTYATQQKNKELKHSQLKDKR